MSILDNIKNAAQALKGVAPAVKKARKIGKKSTKQQLYRFNQEIEQWKAGIESFEDPNNTSSVEIIRVYNDMVLDAHLYAVLEARITRTTSKNNKILDDKGEEIPEQTALLSGPWFRDFLRLSLESKFFGYSLIQFGNQIGQSFEEVEVVPREYVYQQKKAIRTSPFNSFDLVPFDEGEFKPWVLGVGKSNDIGILCKAAPLVIFKKASFGAWTEFAELFGAPFRLGKTNTSDPALHENMFNMLENMGRNAYGVFDIDDEIEFVRDSKTDAYEVFNQLIERTNGELSKLILGSTMGVDDGSSRSQAEVHERTSATINKEDAVFLADVVNKQLIPFLNAYHGFNITGLWAWDDSENTTKKEQFEIDAKIIELGYDVPLAYLTDTYGTPIDGRTLPKEPEPDPKDKEKTKAKADDVKNAIKKKTLLATTYDGFIQSHSCDVCNTLEDSFEETPAPTWSESYIDNIILGVYSGKYSPGNLPPQLYEDIAQHLSKGLFEGLSDEVKLSNIPNPGFANALRNNAFVFSGAKTFTQVKLMSDYLVDANGVTRSFKEYKDFARKTFGDFNVNHLRTEINQAKGSAQMAEKWRQIEDEVDIFPYLKYVTVGDGRVREDHKVLDGVLKPVKHEFWNENYPKNGWNCRCTVQQVDEAVETPDKDITLPEIPDYMKINSGKQKLLFSPEHPYFIVEDQFAAFKKDNFGLPAPAQLAKPAIIKEVIKRTPTKKPGVVALEGFTGKHKYGGLKGEELLFQNEVEKVVGFKVPDALITSAAKGLKVVSGKLAKEGAWYNNWTKKIYFDETATRFTKVSNTHKFKVVAHELGHSIHYNTRQILSKYDTSAEFKDFKLVMESELKAISKASGGRNITAPALSSLARKADVDYFAAAAKRREFFKSDPARSRTYGDTMERALGFSDTLQGFSKGRYGQGHTKKYQRDNGDKEIFAHLSENFFVGNSYFKEALPKTYAAGLKYYKSILK